MTDDDTPDQPRLERLMSTPTVFDTGSRTVTVTYVTRHRVTVDVPEDFTVDDWDAVERVAERATPSLVFDEWDDVDIETIEDDQLGRRLTIN